MLWEVFEETTRVVQEAIEREPARPRMRDVGVVAQVGSGIAQVTGLPNLGAEELLEFPGGLLGIATDLGSEKIGVMLLSSGRRLTAGMEARATGRQADAPVGEGLLGRVIDATGRPLDGRNSVDAAERHRLERAAPAILDRAPVTVPLSTGLKVVDALIPIGRGQRELIVGDRQTGKTTIAVDTILNQPEEVICIYCAIGQRGTAVARVIETLRSRGKLEQCIVVVAAPEDPPGLQFATPYAATTMAEFFMYQGRDVLLVYDDLTRHARAYRELSLLLRRPPGREAYPGDIFYIHSRLLERATHLKEELGGGSLTALPIVETEAQDISAYIPTNLISITDGQIYVSPNLYRKGLLPAVDVGRSVSRVGGKAQRPSYRKVAGDLRLTYSQFEELEAFARFATRLDEDTRATIERGRRVREALKQKENAPLPVAEQMTMLRAVTVGLFDETPVDRMGEIEQALREAVREEHPEACERLDAGETLDDAAWEAIEATSRRVIDERGEGSPES